MNTDDEAVFEPLSEHEQAMLDRLHTLADGTKRGVGHMPARDAPPRCSKKSFAPPQGSK